MISQQIWNWIFITRAILGICIEIEKSSIGKRIWYLHSSGWHTLSLGTLSSLIITVWCRLSSGRRWCRFLGRSTLSLAPPVCLRILCLDILDRTAAVHWSFTNHCQVSFYRSFHLSMPKKHNSPLLLWSDFSTRIHDQVLHFLHWGTWKPSFGHFGHIQSKGHVGQF